MAKIKPFRAFRPRPDIALQVASLPYDVISSEEARALAKDNPFSFLHVSKPEIDLDPSISLYDDRVYAKARENLYAMIQAGILLRDPTPSLYLYQQRMGEHVQTGVVAACSVREYEMDLIKRHEHTRKDKEDDRTRHVTETNANAEPVFLAYRANPSIDEAVRRLLSQPPVCDIVTDDGFGHTVWLIDHPKDISLLCDLFAQVPALYIADGHHRTAAAIRHGQLSRQKNPAPTGEEPYEYFMAVMFPHNQLRILDYNRIVRDLGGLSPNQFLSLVSERFQVQPAPGPKPQAPRTFTMFLDGQWYLLTVPPELVPDDPVRSLDVSILQENLLGPILGITDPRTDKRIDFVGGIRGPQELERRCREGWAVAFALYPTTMEQLLRVADAGQVMPPKSTWFEPKLRSGLIVRLLDE